jgi:hypothetical protein
MPLFAVNCTYLNDELGQIVYGVLHYRGNRLVVHCCDFDDGRRSVEGDSNM